MRDVATSYQTGRLAFLNLIPLHRAVAQLSAWKKNRNGANLKLRHTLRAGGVIIKPPQFNETMRTKLFEHYRSIFTKL